MKEIQNELPEGFKLGAVQYFSGNVYIKPLVVPDAHTNCSIADVLFEPGVRNNWHVHPGNQVLIIKEGKCYFQEEGAEKKIMNAGEVVNILPGIKHWHGASPDGRMIHTAINLNTEKGTVEWLEPVTDEQYSDSPAS
jgi:quercetin dioxygenase-like cupin family protein